MRISLFLFIPCAGIDDCLAIICADDLVPIHVAAHADSFATKRMRKIGQRRAVDYTSTVVRYMQVIYTTQILLSFIICSSDLPA